MIPSFGTTQTPGPGFMAPSDGPSSRSSLTPPTCSRLPWLSYPSPLGAGISAARTRRYANSSSRCWIGVKAQLSGCLGLSLRSRPLDRCGPAEVAQASGPGAPRSPSSTRRPGSSQSGQVSDRARTTPCPPWERGARRLVLGSSAISPDVGLGGGPMGSHAWHSPTRPDDSRNVAAVGTVNVEPHAAELFVSAS